MKRIKTCVVVLLCAGLQFSCGEVDSEDSQLNSICGPNNELQDVIQYNNAVPGLNYTFVMKHQGPVGALTNRAGRAFCSGTLIGDNTFLTAAHCLRNETMWVAFNYQLSANGRLESRDSYEVREIIESRRSNLDYAVLRLEGQPGRIWGKARLSTSLPQRGSQVTVIQHPSGQPKKVHGGPISSVSQSRMNYVLDTLGGSSGSGVLDQQGNIIAVHTNGGCRANGGSNSGVHMEAITRASPLVRSMVGN